MAQYKIYSTTKTSVHLIIPPFHDTMMTLQLVLCKIYNPGTRRDTKKRLMPIFLDFDVPSYENINIFVPYIL